MADAKNVLKKLGKKVLKKLVFSKIFIIVIIGIIIFMMLFSGLIYILDLIEGVLKEGDLKNVPYAASTYTNGVTISSQGLTTEMTPQELWDSMIQNGSNVKKYLKSPKELEKLMKAEIVTQNPKIGKGDLDGIIEFKRRKTDKSVIDLKYVDEETFNSYIDAYNENGDETALGYYTIDANGNALIAQWTKTTTTVEVSVDGATPTSETTVEYSMSSAMINYKSVVQKYSMPFDYLWALLITTNGKKFVLELADYVIEDSEIEITGTEAYTKFPPKVDGPKSETISVPVLKEEKDPVTGLPDVKFVYEDKTQTTTTTTTIETNNVNADLTKADTWIIDYKKDEDGNVTSKPKVDKDSNKRNFITILNKYLYTKQNLDSSSNMLFEILERNTSTANMVDLTKYLLQVATGNKYYKGKEYDFSEYEDNTFEDYSSYYGDYVVKTNDSASAPIVENKDKLEEGLKKWLKNSSNMKSNALSVLDTVFECQEKYHVNAVFTYAFLRTETGIGIADTDYVTKDNNWGSWALGLKYTSPGDNIITITSKMESGNIYFTKGNITVSKIGAIYCPNMPEYPNQGDEWIKTVTTYMNELYSSMGMTSIASGGEGTIGVYTSSTGKTYNLYLQGSGAPWEKEDYGNSHSMKMAGCGPTAAAIIASSYNAQINPSTVRQAIVSKYGLGNNSSAIVMKDILGQMLPNVKLEVAGFDENKIKQCLENSGQVWLVVQHCKYTSDAHCMALIDYKEPGMVYVSHGTAKTRPYGWDTISYLKTYNKHAQILYVGGK